MNRIQATQTLRELLDSHELKDWHVRLTSDLTKPFLGMCSYKDKSIILNAHHIDTHPDLEVINTIRHEVAHALTFGHNHDNIWKEKARELGCDNTMPCATYGFSENAIDAIRSGADLKVEFTTETQVIRTPKYTVSRIQDVCETCGKVAKEKSRQEVPTSQGNKLIIQLECGHFRFKSIDSTSPFHLITFDGDKNCKHTFGMGKNRTTCSKCSAHKLYEFQVESARALERAGGKLGIFHEMGLGKTIIALAYLLYHPEDSPFLWITRSGIKYQHAKEIIRILGKSAFPQIINTSKQGLIPDMSCIASYDIFRNMELSKIKEFGFKCIILDECQAIKNPDSSRTQAIRALVKAIPKVIPLSGTPWKNRGSEFFTVLNMLDPVRFYSFKHFKDNWVDEYYEGGKTKEGGIRNPTKFKEYIKDLVIRREREEVMPELPLINRTRLLVELPDYARKTYNKESDDLVKFLDQQIISGEENSLETQRQIMQSLIVMKQIIGIAKVPSTVEYVTEFLEDTDRKIAIFVHHVECGEQIFLQLSNWCKSNGQAIPLRITSSMDGAARNRVAEDFNANKSRILIASTLASGEGLNLQTCSDCVMHERQWNPANEEQAEGRFIRIGQLAQSVNATYVHGDNTVDTILDGIVERKRINYHNGMNNKEFKGGWNESDLIKELVASIKSKGKN